MSEPDKPEAADAAGKNPEGSAVPSVMPPDAPAAETAAARPRMHTATPIAATVGLTLAAMSLQLLWRQLRDFLPSSATGGDAAPGWPMAVLAGLVLLMALAMTVLIASRLRRLLLSVRMTVSLLAMAAVLLASGSAFESEGGLAPSDRVWAGNERRAAAPFSAVLGDDAGKRCGDACIGLFRLMGLTDLPGCWALHVVLTALALGALVRLVWRRPVGAREFGFIAVQAGAVLIAGGLFAGRLFGLSHPGIELNMAAAARPTPIPPRAPTGEEAFSVVLRELGPGRSEAVPRLLALPAGGDAELIDVDPARQPAAARWRGLELEVLEFLPEAYPEKIMVDSGEGRGKPAVRLEFTAPSYDRSVLLDAGESGWWADADLGLEIRFLQLRSAEAAERMAERVRELPAETLRLVDARDKEVDCIQLPAGREKIGGEVVLPAMGLRLRVAEWFSGSRIEAGGASPVQAPPVPGCPIAMRLVPVRDVALGGDAPAGFWVVAGDRPAAPIGEVPPALQGMRFAYGALRWMPLTLNLVEGSPGTFRLGQLRDGLPSGTVTLGVGGEAGLPGGIRLRIAQFMAGAQPQYRPGQPEPGARPVPAVRLAVSRGAVRETGWLFAEGAAPCTLLGAAFALHNAAAARCFDSAVVEVFQHRASLGRMTIDSRTPLVIDGYRLQLVKVVPTAAGGGRSSGLVCLSVKRRPGDWAVVLGMLLAAAGAPLLLWSRFRRMPDPVT